MKTHFKKELLAKIDLLDNISDIKNSELIKLINEISNFTINTLTKILGRHQIVPVKSFIFGEVKEDTSVDFGLKRNRDQVVIADWIMDLQSKTRSYLLSFIVLKESLLHFLKNDLEEVDEAIINILTILFLIDLFNIKTVDNPVLSAIRSKIYPEEIAEYSNYYWDNLLLLLISNNIPFNDVLEVIFEIFDKKETTTNRKIKEFSEWTFSKTIEESSSILPFYTNLKLIELIETLLELGYERSTTSFIARKLDLTQKTIAKRFKALNETFSTYWRSDINYEKINLHNYLFKITINKNGILEKLTKDLLKIPYLKSLFHGTDSNSDIIYSPTLICPHIISDQLSDKLRKMKNENLINDYTLQLVRERYRYFAISNIPHKSSIDVFKTLINRKDTSLKKFTFYKYERAQQIPSHAKPMQLDYNLLYFLSIITSKLLLQARYGVTLNEFKKFYLANNILMTDVDAQTDLLYQNELRAKNKELLTFSLYMRNLMKRSPSVLIFEVPTSNELPKDKFNKIIRKLSVFSLLGQNTIYDRHIFNLPGVAHTHPIRKIIHDFLEKEGLTSSFYTIKFYKSNFVPLQNLFDYEEQKWKIADFK
ncbi:MAG: hypothetical protein KGD59_14735 [Candidatus Heimdallarchaeota archaeon]|nr:hypothetical protein [Candidatus Heimdallarchaeota archaeon]MBY8995804.1 hypothetical protein [Candidatus Heimdallarchaeota archaeon]